jgi:predicted Zn-dependent peptidase
MFKREYLDNGIPVLMEPLKNVRSVAFGVWVKIGSRYEKPEKNGISHFLEHMFFKGTKKRTTKDIAVDIDSMGGDLNAFTTRENTVFYIKLLDEYLEKGLDLLSDIFIHSDFPEDEIEKEKKVIKEEIKMVEDTPEDYIYDLFNQNVWGHEGLGQPVLGRRETIASFTRDDILAHIRKYYGTKDIIISCAGKFIPDSLIKILNEYFGSLRRVSVPKTQKTHDFRQNIKVYSKDLSEAHICIGVPSLPQTSEKIYVMAVLNTILGGGFSSRLFQNIREQRGLAYSIYSFTALYFDTGLWGVYAGVSKRKLKEVTALIISEMLNLENTLTDAELDRAKRHLKGNLILGLESTSSRMNNIARQEIYFSRYISPEEILKSIDIVNMNQIIEMAEKLIKKEFFSINAYGDLPKDILEGIL